MIQNGNLVTVVGSVISTRDITGIGIRGYILRSDRSLVHILFDSTVNLQAANTITLKDLNNGEDITFSLEYLYGKYIVVMEIRGGNPPLETVRKEKDFQTELIFLKEQIPVDIPNGVPGSQQNLYYLPCCSSKVAEDLSEYFGFNWTEEQITFAAEEIESEIYPKYSQGFSDLTGFLNDLNIILNLSLTQAQIDELVFDLENGLFSPKTDAAIPQAPDDMTELIKHPSDSSAPFLTGRNVITRIYVNDPDNTWSADDVNTAWQQVSTAADQIRNWAPSSANVSFVHVPFIATLGETPDYSEDSPDKEWMEQTVKSLGYIDTEEFTKALKATYNADHVIHLFLPHIDGRSYALPYPSWRIFGERACVFFYASCPSSPLLISVIAGGLLVLLTWKLFKDRSAYVLLLILLSSFIYGLALFATYFYFSLKVMNPLEFMKILKDDIIGFMKKANEEEVENHIVSIGDACVKAVTRHEERVVISFIETLHDIFEVHWKLRLEDPEKYNPQYCLSQRKDIPTIRKNYAAEYIIDQYKRIFARSLAKEEKKAVREVDFHLFQMLLKFVSRSGNQVFVEEIMILYYYMLEQAIDTEDDSRFYLYDYVYNLAQRSLERGRIADEYLNELLFQHFFFLIRLIIQKDELILFSKLINSYSLMVMLSPYDVFENLKETLCVSDIIFSIDSASRREILEEMEYLKEIESTRVIRSFFQNEIFSSFEDKLRELRDFMVREIEESQEHTQVQEELDQWIINVLEVLHRMRICLLLHMAFFLSGAFILFTKKKNLKLNACRYFREYWGCMEGTGITMISAHDPPLSFNIEFLTRLLFYKGTPENKLMWQFLEFEHLQEAGPFLYEYYLLLVTYARTRRSEDWRIEFYQNDNFRIMRSRYEFLESFVDETKDDGSKKGDIIRYIDELITRADEWDDLIPEARNAFEETRKWFVEKGNEAGAVTTRIIIALPRDPELECDVEKRIFESYRETTAVEQLAILEELEQGNIENVILDTVKISQGVPKETFIAFPGTHYIDSDTIWREIGKKLSYKEENTILNLILNEVSPINIEKKSAIQIKSEIDHHIHVLEENGYEPNVVFLPLNLLTELKRESHKKDSPIHGTITRTNRKEWYNSSGDNLKIIHSWNKMPFEDVVILDKTAISWKHQIDNATDQRVFVNFEEDTDDKTIVNVSLKTVGNLRIGDQRSICVLKFRESFSSKSP
ncbi:MAG: hypothetical protein WBA22_14410 [Candidatus Methanofastidiosia archaeon]